MFYTICATLAPLGLHDSGGGSDTDSGRQNVSGRTKKVNTAAISTAGVETQVPGSTANLDSANLLGFVEKI